MGSDHFHRVCTFKEAEDEIRAHDVVFVNDCFCRLPAKNGETSWKYCGHTIDVCMGFQKPDNADYPIIEISKDEALRKFEAWKEQGNFFRFMENKGWICCCCSCGCMWFRDKEGNIVKDPCDKSPFIEKTDSEKCDLCGECIPVCAYKARQLSGDELLVDQINCYGCSACEYACSRGAITMTVRSNS